MQFIKYLLSIKNKLGEGWQSDSSVWSHYKSSLELVSNSHLMAIGAVIMAQLNTTGF